jgi:hypothetical protein
MTEQQRAALVSKFLAAIRVDTGYTIALAQAGAQVADRAA